MFESIWARKPEETKAVDEATLKKLHWEILGRGSSAVFTVLEKWYDDGDYTKNYSTDNGRQSNYKFYAEFDLKVCPDLVHDKDALLYLVSGLTNDRRGKGTKITIDVVGTYCVQIMGYIVKERTL